MGKHAEAIELIKASMLFDEEWYRNRYPDVAQLSMDPVKHYLKIGAMLHRDPGPNFSTLGYLQAYPDVEQAGLNPLYHYVKMGKAEGRLAPMSKAVWETRMFSGTEVKPLKPPDRSTESSPGTCNDLEKELASSKRKCTELVEENELLLLQLHQVQEELEEYFLKYQELAKTEPPRIGTN